jgi:hypothetical protein
MLSESVEERAEKLLEEVKKIESSELSNQKEADILSSANFLSAWAVDKRNYGSCSSELRSAKSLRLERSTRRLTTGKLSNQSQSGSCLCVAKSTHH